MRTDAKTQRWLEDMVHNIGCIYRDHALANEYGRDPNHDFVHCEVCRIGKIIGAEPAPQDGAT